MAVQVGLCQTWSETPKTGFLASRLILSLKMPVSIVVNKIKLLRLAETSSCFCESPRENTCLRCFRPGTTKTDLYSHGKMLEVCWILEERLYYLCSENKGAAKLICVFVFANANCWFSRAPAHIV